MTAIACRAVGHAAMLLGAGRETVDSRIDPAVGSSCTRRSATLVAAGRAAGHPARERPRAAWTRRLALLREAIRIGPERARAALRSCAPSCSERAPACLDLLAGSRVRGCDRSCMERLLSVVGLLAILGGAWALSTNRQAIRVRTVAWGLGLQFALALFVLKVPIGQRIFGWLGEMINALLELSFEGPEFVFGEMGKHGRRPAAASSSPSTSCPPSSSCPRCWPSSTTSASCR